MLQRLNRSTAKGSVVGITLGCVAATVAGTAMVVSYVSSTTLVEASSSRVRLTASGARGWLIRAGLDPSGLAAAGFQPQEIGVVVGNAVAYLAENSLQLRDLDSQLADARKTLPRLEQAATAGSPVVGAAQTFAQGQAAVASLEEQVQGHLSGLFAAAVGGLDAGKVERLTTLKGNRGRGVPVQYLVQARTDEEVVALRDALAAQSIAQREGRQSPEQATQVVTTATTPAVSAAQQGLANLAAITTAWNAASAEAEGR